MVAFVSLQPTKLAAAGTAIEEARTDYEAIYRSLTSRQLMDRVRPRWTTICAGATDS
jgi:hypothetical protein